VSINFTHYKFSNKSRSVVKSTGFRKIMQPLNLVPQKMQLIWLGSRQQLEKFNKVDIELMSASLSPLSTTHDLCVTLV